MHCGWLSGLLMLRTSRSSAHWSQGLLGSAERYVQHLLASTSGPASELAEAQADGYLDQEQLGVRHDPNAEELHLTFASQCEHHLLPFRGSVQVRRRSLPVAGLAHQVHSHAPQQSTFQQYAGGGHRVEL